MKHEWVPIGQAPERLKKELGFEVPLGTLRQWRFWNKYPGLFTKLGHRVYLDLEMAKRIAEKEVQKSIEQARKIQTILRR